MTAAELSWALREVQRAQAEVDRRLAGVMQLRPTDYQALSHVLTAAEPLGPAELSSRLAMSTGSGTELVDRLVTSGHLERQRHPTDRRRVVLHTTPRAVRRVLSELEPLFSALDELAETFTADEQAVILRYLRRAAGLVTAYARDEADLAGGDAVGRR